MRDSASRTSLLDGAPVLHYMGCSTFANHTVLPKIAAVINMAKAEIGCTAIVFGLGGIGLNVVQGLRMAGGDQIVGALKG